VGRRAARGGRLARRPGGLRARRLRPFAWAAGALAAIALVAVLVAGGNGGASKGPSVLAVAKATEAGPSAGAPRADGRGFVDAKVPPVRFPDWGPLEWPATGRRSDTVGGRDVTTVYYRGRRGSVAAYAIASGRPLEVPDTARTVTRDGETYHVLEADGDRIVVWEEGGRTCVLRAPARVPESRLLELAAWQPA